ncbi:riboflavin kinase [Diutina catenulata]
MRPETVVPETVEKPYPIVSESEIVAGFGRGSSELGIPTANIHITPELNSLDVGIYYGYCRLTPVDHQPDEVERNDGHTVEFNYGQELPKCELTEVRPMVMSIGFNPFYNNKTKAAEVHIMHKYTQNFYGAKLKYCVLGYVRPELDYTTKEALIADINKDIEISNEILQRPNYRKFKDL